MGLKHSHRIRYVTMAEGNLHEGKNGEAFEELEGVLAGVTWYLDPGSAQNKIQPRYKLELDVRDETDTYCVQTALGRLAGREPNPNVDTAVTGGWMLASYLNGVQPGEVLKLSCTPGTDVEKVTAAWLWVDDGRGGWKIAQRDQFPGDPVQRLRLSIEVIQAHAAWREPRVRKGEDNRASAPELAPEQKEFWGMVEQMGLPDPKLQRELYIGFLGRELKNPHLTDFDDVSPKGWREATKLLDFVRKDPANWPAAFKPYAPVQQVPDPTADEYDPFAEEEQAKALQENVKPLAASELTINVGGMGMSVKQMTALSALAVDKGLNPAEAVQRAKAEEVASYDELMLFVASLPDSGPMPFVEDPGR